MASKILSERVTWDFARDNRSLDLAASESFFPFVTLVVLNSQISEVLPTFIFGPFHPDFLTPGPDRLGSNDHIYNLIKGEAGRPLGFQLAPQFVDVRDVAVAQVKALSVPPAESKRYLISSGFLLKKQAVEYLAKTYPELTDRLPTLEGAANIDEKSVTVIDTGKAERELGLKEYIHWQKTLSDTIQSLLACEKAWEN